MVPLNETRLYTEDWIGLKAVDEVFSLNSLYSSLSLLSYPLFAIGKLWYLFCLVWYIFFRLVSYTWWRCLVTTFSSCRWMKTFPWQVAANQRCTLTFFISITVLAIFSGPSWYDHHYLPWQLKPENVKIKGDLDLVSFFILSVPHFWILFSNIRQRCVSDCFLLTLLVCHISLFVLWLRALSDLPQFLF